jgi:hypothetical protein
MSNTAKNKAAADSQQSVNKPKAEKSQMEGPAAYAPLPDEQSSADEAREDREKMQQKKRKELVHRPGRPRRRVQSELGSVEWGLGRHSLLELINLGSWVLWSRGADAGGEERAMCRRVGPPCEF